MSQQPETNIQGGGRMWQMELSAQTRGGDQQRKWLLEKREPAKVRRKREPDSLKLF